MLREVMECGGITMTQYGNIKKYVKLNKNLTY